MENTMSDTTDAPVDTPVEAPVQAQGHRDGHDYAAQAKVVLPTPDGGTRYDY